MPDEFGFSPEEQRAYQAFLNSLNEVSVERTYEALEKKVLREYQDVINQGFNFKPSRAGEIQAGSKQVFGSQFVIDVNKYDLGELFAVDLRRKGTGPLREAWEETRTMLLKSLKGRWFKLSASGGSSEWPDTEPVTKQVKAWRRSIGYGKVNPSYILRETDTLVNSMRVEKRRGGGRLQFLAGQSEPNEIFELLAFFENTPRPQKPNARGARLANKKRKEKIRARSSRGGGGRVLTNQQLAFMLNRSLSRTQTATGRAITSAFRGRGKSTKIRQRAGFKRWQLFPIQEKAENIKSKLAARLKRGLQAYYKNMRDQEGDVGGGI